MFRDTSTHSFPPISKATRLQLSAHQPDDLSLTETGSLSDNVKTRAVMPCKLNDRVYLSVTECLNYYLHI